MKKSFSQIHQFKISLLGIRPQIWRRIEVPDTYTFWDLHVAIQDSMGWLDYHLHEFEIPNPETRQPDCIGIPDDEWDDDREVLAGWRTPIDSYFSLKNSLALYKYDFGDGWEHEVRLEGIAAREPKSESIHAAWRALGPVLPKTWAASLAIGTFSRPSKTRGTQNISSCWNGPEEDPLIPSVSALQGYGSAIRKLD